jgi:hypothetical protein
VNTQLLLRSLPVLLGSALSTLIGCAGFDPAPEATTQLSLAANGSPVIAVEKVGHAAPGLDPSVQVPGALGPMLAMTPKDLNLFEAACDMVSALPCAPAGCQHELQAHWAHASAFGCGSEFLALWTCVADEGATCESGLMVEAPDCALAAAELKQCQPECVSSIVAGACSYSCVGGHPFGAGCEQQGNQLHCRCGSGSHTGLEFNLAGECDSPINGKDLMQILAQKCQ